MSRAGGLRRTLFGIASRRAVLDYLLVTGLIMLILLITAWTIDMAETFPSIRRAAESQGVSVASLLLPYLAFRTVDIVDRLLPMACFFGVFIAEILRRRRLETVILASSGAGLPRRIAPVLIFGILIGGLLSALESPLRPAAIFAQVDLGLGTYARWYRRGETGAPVWFLTDDIAVRARLLRDEEPEFRDALVFTGFRAPQLQTIYAADRIVPTGDRFVWDMKDVTAWPAEAGARNAKRHDSLPLQLTVLPEEVEYHRVLKFFIPTAPLAALATRRDVVWVRSVDVAIWRRRTAGLLPGSMALVGAALVPAGFAGRLANVPRLLALALFGYLTVVSVKVFWALGELGVLPPAPAVLAPIGFAIAAAAVLFWWRP